MKATASEYMMVLRDTDWDEGLSTEEVAETIDRYHEWFNRLLEKQVITGGRPLLAGGRMVMLSPDGNATDGPFVESKEVIGGHINIRAADLAEAVEIAKTFPPLARGVKIELRELADLCPVSRRHAGRTGG